MRRIIIESLQRGTYFSTSHWDKLKNTKYISKHIDGRSITLQADELEIKYTKHQNKILKEVLNRHIDSEEQELTSPQSSTDDEAFRHFKISLPKHNDELV